MPFPSNPDLWEWFVEQQHTSIGVRCGAVSGSLVVLDIEGVLAGDLDRINRIYDHLLASGSHRTHLQAELEAKTTTPSGGFHLWFRITDGPAPASQRLCYKHGENGYELLAETRGEGAQIVAPPGDGRMWETGEPNAIGVSADEFASIIAAYASIDESARQVTPPPPKRTTTIFDLPRQRSIADVLSDCLLAGELAWGHVLHNGWSPVGYDRSGRSMWLRPDFGCKPTSLTSAHGYEMYGDAPTPVLVVHSAAVPDLPLGEGNRLTPFRVLTHCWFGGDDQAAFKALETRTPPEGLVLPDVVWQRISEHIALRAAPQPAELATPKADSTGDSSDSDDDDDDEEGRRFEADNYYRSILTDEIYRQRAREEARRILDGSEWVEPRPTPILADALQQELPPLVWRIDSLLVENGNALLIGERKVGKTSLCNHLMRCLVDRHDFLGHFPVAPPSGRVVMLDFEMSERQAYAWLKDAEIDNLEQIAILHLRGKPNPLSSIPGREWLIGELARLEASVLIVDPLAVAFNGIAESENDNSGVRRALALLDQVAAEAGSSETVLVTHAGKNTEQGARGASAIEDWPDSLWRLFRGDQDSDDRYFSAMGRDVDYPESRLGWDMAGRSIWVAGAGESRRDISRRKAGPRLVNNIINALNTFTELTAPALAQETDSPTPEVSKTLRRMEAHGLVTKTRGNYRIGDTTPDAINAVLAEMGDDL